MLELAEDDLYAPRRAGLDAGVIKLTRCAACKTVEWYPLARCVHCRSMTWEWFDVPPRGQVHSWCRVVRPTVPVEGLTAPYVLALVEVDEADGARVVALAEDPTRAPVVGERVRLTTRPVAGAAQPHFVVTDAEGS